MYACAHRQLMRHDSLLNLQSEHELSSMMAKWLLLFETVAKGIVSVVLLEIFCRSLNKCGDVFHLHYPSAKCNRFFPFHAEDWTRDLGHSRQVLCCWATSPPSRLAFPFGFDSNIFRAEHLESRERHTEEFCYPELIMKASDGMFPACIPSVLVCASFGLYRHFCFITCYFPSASRIIISHAI